MNKKIEKKDGLLKIDLTFDEKEFQAALNKAEINLAKEVVVPGYRKGHAPLDLAKKYLNSNRLSDEIINNFLKSADKEFTSTKLYEQYKILNIRPEVNVSKFEEKETDISITYLLSPEVIKLGDYKGIKSDITEKKITDKDVEEELKKLAKENEELVSVDREAKLNDTANIDFVGYLNGKAFDGGEGKSFDLVLGSNHFVPGFEEQIVGHKAGDKFEIKVTMPENYPDELANKETVFEVTINSIKEGQVPEINDEFATTLTGDYVSKNLAELKEKVKNKLVENAQKEYINQKANDYLLKCRDSSTYEIADKYVDMIVEDRLASERQRVENQGLTLEEYLKLVKMDFDSFKADIRNNALAEIKNGLVYDAITTAENIPAITNADIEKQIGLPISAFTNQYSSYLKMQKLNDSQIANEIRRYLNSVATNLIQQRVIDKILILNGDKKEETVEKKENKEKSTEKKAASEKKTTTAKKTTKKVDAEGEKEDK